MGERTLEELTDDDIYLALTGRDYFHDNNRIFLKFGLLAHPPLGGYEPPISAEVDTHEKREEMYLKIRSWLHKKEGKEFRYYAPIVISIDKALEAAKTRGKEEDIVQFADELSVLVNFMLSKQLGNHNVYNIA